MGRRGCLRERVAGGDGGGERVAGGDGGGGEGSSGGDQGRGGEGRRYTRGVEEQLREEDEALGVQEPRDLHDGVPSLRKRLGFISTHHMQKHPPKEDGNNRRR